MKTVIRPTEGPVKPRCEIAIIERAELSDWVRERAVRAFQLLGEAEGQVHGMPAAEVSLHEVGAVDALIDIVGGIGRGEFPPKPYELRICGYCAYPSVCRKDYVGDE